MRHYNSRSPSPLTQPEPTRMPPQVIIPMHQLALALLSSSVRFSFPYRTLIGCYRITSRSLAGSSRILFPLYLPCPHQFVIPPPGFKLTPVSGRS